MRSELEHITILIVKRKLLDCEQGQGGRDIIEKRSKEREEKGRNGQDNNE